MGYGPWGHKKQTQLKQLSMHVRARAHTHTHTHTHTMGLGTLALRTSGGVQCSMVRIAQHRLLADSPVSTEYRTESRELENSNIN